MDRITITYTREEADALIKLLDLACRQGGLNVAEAAIVLTNKFKELPQKSVVSSNVKRKD